MATVKENLIAAKALIDTPEKWGKGSWGDDENCKCAIGALRSVVGYRVHCGDVETALEIQLPSDFQGQCVENYNDDPDTTHADIMALFDRAIAAQGGE